MVACYDYPKTTSINQRSPMRLSSSSGKIHKPLVGELSVADRRGVRAFLLLPIFEIGFTGNQVRQPEGDCKKGNFWRCKISPRFICFDMLKGFSLLLAERKWCKLFILLFSLIIQRIFWVTQLKNAVILQENALKRCLLFY